jgi:hypothetical protein
MSPRPGGGLLRFLQLAGGAIDISALRSIWRWLSQDCCIWDKKKQVNYSFRSNSSSKKNLIKTRPNWRKKRAKNRKLLYTSVLLLAEECVLAIFGLAPLKSPRPVALYPREGDGWKDTFCWR